LPTPPFWLNTAMTVMRESLQDPLAIDGDDDCYETKMR
jgi:hypothetical protein